MKRRRVKWTRKYLPSVLFLLLCAGICFVIGRGIASLFPVSAQALEPEPTPESHLIVVTPTPAPTDPEEALIQAVLACDHEAGLKIEYEVDYNDLYDLSRIMQAEKGPCWPDMFIMAIGEVVLNRVESPEFPDSIHEVIYQPGQYEPAEDGSLEYTHPDENTVRLAMRLLQGERVLEDPQVIFQALFPQGRGSKVEYTDEILGTTTYFCWTSYPEFYE